MVITTHWPQEILNEIIDVLFSSEFLELMAAVYLVKLASGDCQHWFGYWLGIDRQHTITWGYVDPDLCHHMASLSHNRWGNDNKKYGISHLSRVKKFNLININKSWKLHLNHTAMLYRRIIIMENELKCNSSALVTRFQHTLGISLRHFLGVLVDGGVFDNAVKDPRFLHSKATWVRQNGNVLRQYKSITRSICNNGLFKLSPELTVCIS